MDRKDTETLQICVPWYGEQQEAKHQANYVVPVA